MNITNGSDNRLSQNGFDYSRSNIWPNHLNCMWESSSTNSNYMPFSVGSLTNYQPNKQCKRKAESFGPITTKQHITEEKMAAHMSRLHISSDYSPSREKESTEIKEQRLYMCDEMRKLQSESIIPAALMNRIERPCTSMAVVLWQPPNSILNLNPIRQVGLNENNNNSEQDFNRMDLDAL